MTYIFAYIVGVASAAACIWFGFYLGRMNEKETPTFSLPETFEGEILDQAVYPFEIADE